MTKTFTPGPWMVWKRAQDAIYVMPKDPDYGAVASVHSNAGDKDERREGNARLIAASPCMVEALEEIERIAQSEDIGLCKADRIKIEQAACKALAKARGE